VKKISRTPRDGRSGIENWAVRAVSLFARAGEKAYGRLSAERFGIAAARSHAQCAFMRNNCSGILRRLSIALVT